jgi:hypothetical protein
MRSTRTLTMSSILSPPYPYRTCQGIDRMFRCRGRSTRQIPGRETSRGSRCDEDACGR